FLSSLYYTTHCLLPLLYCKHSSRLCSNSAAPSLVSDSCHVFNWVGFRYTQVVYVLAGQANMFAIFYFMFFLQGYFLFLFHSLSIFFSSRPRTQRALFAQMVALNKCDQDLNVNYLMFSF